MSKLLHGGEDRDRVHAAMERTGIGCARRSRYRECGSDAHVAVHRDSGEYKIFGHFCGDRFCRFCTGRRAAVIKHELLHWLKSRSVRFITLTLRHQAGQDLPGLLDKLYDRFHHLRRLKPWKNHVEGGASFLEVKHTAQGWHVHVHILAEGRYFPQSWLSDLWQGVTRDSRIVDIRQPRNEAAAEYCAKYAAKGWSDEGEMTEADLSDLIHCMQGRRTVLAFGTWYRKFSITQLLDCGMDEIDRLADKLNWTFVDTFASIVAKARGGDDAARSILAALGRAYLCGPQENSS